METIKENNLRDKLTHAIEDYLKTIYELSLVNGRATTNNIAGRLNVTPASVTGMVKKLAALDPPLLDYIKHRGVTLTYEGEKVALEILRHHRLLELFLQETLGYTWDEVHEEADRLEHVISEEMEERIAQSLGDPVRDQHGDPIPTRDLEIPSPEGVSLFDSSPGQQVIIRRVSGRDPELLRYLSGLGLTPDVRLSILNISPFDDNLHLKIEGEKKTLVLGPRITRNIFVESV